MGVVADMIRAGVDPELVERVHLEIVAAGNARHGDHNDVTHVLRSPGAVRQQRYRDRKALRDITRDDQEITKKEGPQTPKEKLLPSEPTVPQGDVPSPLDENQKTVLFSAGLRWLGQATGKSEQQLRPLVGRMLRDIGGDSHAAQLVGIFRDAKNQEKADPISWIQAVIRSRGARAGPAPDGAAAVIRKIHENLNAPRNHPDDPSWQAGAPAAGSAPRLASPHERDRDRPERPYLDLVAASGK